MYIYNKDTSMIFVADLSEQDILDLETNHQNIFVSELLLDVYNHIETIKHTIDKSCNTRYVIYNENNTIIIQEESYPSNAISLDDIKLEDEIETLYFSTVQAILNYTKLTTF